jgi:hypothetical protein
MSRGHDTGQVLLETQVRFSSETVWIRTDCPKEPLYFPLGIVLPCLSNARVRCVMRLSLHLLLPAIGFRLPTRTSGLGHTPPFKGFSSHRELLQR